jgi:RNA polymerase sigma-54 factor
MSQNQGQIQEQKLEQRLGQSITQQQLLHAQLVEMPLPQLLERIDTEMNDNPALETVADTPDFPDAPDNLDDDAPDDFDSQREREDRLSALDEGLQGIGRDDEDLPVFHGGNNVNEEREQMVYGEATSFYHQLREQLTFCELTERERDIMEYFIGSLDDDGLLRKSLSQIGDELAVYYNIDATEKELESVLRKLQDFDPAGIGARSLQECLLLQIARRDDSRLKTLMQRVVSDFFDEFTKKHWDKIQSSLQLSDVQAKALFQELRRLNPKPGASLGETMGHSIQQITPDFIIDTQDDGVITFTLNNAEVPELQV